MRSPAFTRYLIRCRHTRPVQRHFSHAVFVNGYVTEVFGHPLPHVGAKETPPWIVIPCPIESGRVSYEEDEPYHLGLTLVGRGFPDSDTLCRLFCDAGAHEVNALTVESSGLRFEDALELPDEEIADQVARIRRLERLTLQFVTPLDIEQKIPGGDAIHFDADYFDPPHFFKTLHRRLHDLAKLGRDDVEPLIDPPTPPVTLEHNGLLWLKVPTRDPGPDAPDYHGAVGMITLTGDFSSWAESLVLGQYLHVGKRTNFGFGRYTIRELADTTPQGFVPARTFLSMMLEPDNLQAAWEDVRANRGAPGTDDDSIDEFDADQAARLGRLSEQLRDGSYRPTDLRGVVIEKPDGTLRSLAIPSVTDRVAQRALVLVLAPTIDGLLEDSSYAYRRGHSRMQARDAIQQAYDDGFRYALRADIDDFFDDVDWHLLSDKVIALFPWEPLSDILIRWIEAPVRYRGRTIRRSRGLPQGAAISPLLANLFLDEFDETMAAFGFRLIRYADDFVVLCKSRSEAEAAQRAAEAALADLDLELNEAKTSVAHFDHGFRYLGYLFCRSVALDSPARDDDSVTAQPDFVLAGRIPKASWLSALDPSVLTALPAAVQRRGAAATPLRIGDEDAVSSDERSPLYLDSPGLRVRSARGTLVVTNVDTNEIIERPLERVSHIVVAGNIRMTLPAALRSSHVGVPVFFTHASGELYAAVNPIPDDWRLWQSQSDFLANGDTRREFARRVVAAKLNNQAITLRNRHDDRLDGAVRRLTALEKSCMRESDVAALRGYEGRGAVVYFDACKRLLGPQWRFGGRQKRPAPDPVNAMLSYGYSLLYYRCSAALQMHGLNPTLGIFHEPSDTYHSLAADLQEEFRHLVDGVALRMVRKGEVHPDGFIYPEERPGCWMPGPTRKKVIAAFEDRLKDEFTPAGEPTAVTYRRFIDRQAAQIRDLVTGRTGEYRPLRSR